jgi:Zn-dependent peptidase ImmA (M78 family)
MTLRRGFKSEANGLARAMRNELGLQIHAALDPWMLAEHLAIPVMVLSELQGDCPLEVAYLLGASSGVFSAVTVFRGSNRIIVHNDGHTRARQAANLAHELGHALLLHQPAPALDLLGCRDWNNSMEEEANWLGPALLISDEAALHIAREELSVTEAAERYGVSDQLVRMRLNVSAAKKRLQLSAAPRKVHAPIRLARSKPA